jgi:hypothetical protein
LDSSITSLESCIAMVAAATAYWMKMSIFFRSFLSMKSSGLKSDTCPAMRVGKSSHANFVIGVTPERPARTASQFLRNAGAERADRSQPGDDHSAPRSTACAHARFSGREGCREASLGATRRPDEISPPNSQ